MGGPNNMVNAGMMQGQMGAMNNMNNQHMMMQQTQAQPIQMTIDQKFVSDCHKIIPAMIPENPNHKDQAGTVIFDYVQLIVGTEKAPKITGMLIELPVQQIRQLLTSW
jgi:hypothetical protein